MAALVQTLPQQTSTVTMISTRPSSSSGVQSHSPRNTPGQRYNNASSTGYRGLPSIGPVAPYAFTSTPQLSSNGVPLRQGQNPHLRIENRTSSAPVIPHLLPTNASPAYNNPRFSSQSSLSTSSSASSTQLRRSQDDAAIPTRRSSNDVLSRPKSAIFNSGSNANMAYSSPVKPSPDRYHRGHRRFDTTGSVPDHLSGNGGAGVPSGAGNASPVYSHPNQSNSSQASQTYQSFRGHNFTAGTQTRATADDMSIVRQQNPDLAKRYRRRSVGSLETAGLSHENDPQETPSPHPNMFINPPARADSQDWRQKATPRRPNSSHAHNGSSESVNSSRSAQSSRPSSAKRDSPTASSLSSQTPVHVTPVSKQEVKLVNVPSRATEPTKRIGNPSPLSQPMTMSPQTPTFERPVSPEKAPQPAAKQPPLASSSPAAQQLAELSKKDKSKPKSKLRRAFSFGSAAELRKASAQNNMEKAAATQVNKQANKRSSKYEDELEPEQAAIAERQEAGGLGESIYSGQGNFFTGSTDNLSISSTASSASIMLRKMGKGVKKSTRSLVGLFRPKSVVGVPAADGPVVQPPTAQISMVTVEAEREKVNVNADPHDQVGGGTGFPKLERNSMDAVQASAENGRPSADTPRSRRSIVGGERERAEVLAAVKKGILKRTDSNQASPVPRIRENRMPDFNLPQIPHVNDSPHSSTPSTPADDHPPRSGHRRTDSVAIDDGDDYFSSIARFAAVDVKHAPLTPSGSRRNISFSPRLQFHDTWPGQEYDRRGEIATCNRLTPMLAQQIKEELNTFKMEMEVHESSKVYTHFF